LTSFESQLTRLYDIKRSILIYTTLFVVQLRMLLMRSDVDEFSSVHKGQKDDIDKFRNFKTLVTWAQTLSSINIQMAGSYSDTMKDIKAVYPTFTEHAIMKFVYDSGGWLQEKMDCSTRGYKTKKPYPYQSVFDEGKSHEFRLGDALDTVSTSDVAAAGGARLAHVASAMPLTGADGVAGGAGAVAMAVDEAPPKAAARRAPKKIRFDADARYDSIAEEAGEPAA
jgi:hypothetical protein